MSAILEAILATVAVALALGAIIGFSLKTMRGVRRITDVLGVDAQGRTIVDLLADHGDRLGRLEVRVDRIEDRLDRGER